MVRPLEKKTGGNRMCAFLPGCPQTTYGYNSNHQPKEGHIFADLMRQELVLAGSLSKSGPVSVNRY